MMSKVSNKIIENLKISTENTYICSMLMRLVLGISLFVPGVSYQSLPIVVFIISDVSQYMLASIMYKIIGNLGELYEHKGKEESIYYGRPAWVNYPSYACYYLKYTVFLYLIIGLI